MRGLGACGMMVALLLGGSSALAAPEDGAGGDPKPAATSWWGSWFGGGARAPEKPKPLAGEGQGSTRPAGAARPEAPAKPPTLVEKAARLRAREEAKYMRRCEVCDRLIDIAEQTNDVTLRQRAKDMADRAWEVYQKRTAHLPQSQAVFESDEKAIQKHAPVPVPSAGSAMFTVTGNEGRAAREDKR